MLRRVLALDPQNERAKTALIWAEKQTDQDEQIEPERPSEKMVVVNGKMVPISSLNKPYSAHSSGQQIPEDRSELGSRGHVV